MQRNPMAFYSRKITWLKIIILYLYFTTEELSYVHF